MKTIFKGREKVNMVCLKDPMGKVTDEIEAVDESEVIDGERDVDEGEADSGVIPWDDLCPVLSLLTICRLFNTNVFALGRAWKEKSVVGKWTKGAKGTSADRSGGGTPHRYPQTFLRNPQYIFDVPVQEEELVIQLIQWPLEVMDAETSHVPLAIAINVLQIEENRKYRLHTLLDCCPLMVGCGPSSTRELFHRGFFSRGRFLLIPTTEVPGDSANYFLRIFSLNSDVKLREVKRDYPVSCRFQFLESCFGQQIFVSSVTIKDAQGLKRQMGSCNPYCVVICEGSKVKTEVRHNTKDPIWNMSFIFYRKKIDKPIVIRVYSHNFIMPDNFLGEAYFPALVNHTKAEIQTDLVNPKMKKRIGSGRSDSADSATDNRGSITVEILTEDDPMAV
ncbi:hypothetical protein J437_LFUL003564 [Ladona fulva]|uniref:C2 domain-containing protein n=1 Tax=Ladona fulva TaxID=123851 RepID=A0A8K0JZM3_LADFU|nr:hypothetical protein J437_LFUL003564 [Ladona fulva]